MSEPLRKPNQIPESYSPKEVPEIIQLAARGNLRPQETLLESFDVNGAAVDVVDWRETIWCGKLAYGKKNNSEPNVDKLLHSYLKLDNPKLTREPSEPEWSVCVSLNYLSERPRGIMFGMQVDTERQPKVYDIYKVPPARFMRVLLCEETAAALGVEEFHGGIPPYEWIGERIAPRCGYRCGSDTLPVFEYYGYYDPETNRHKFCYLYVPVERADEESYSPKEKPEIISMAAAQGDPRIAYSVSHKGGEADSFETERLLIRHFRREDWRDMQEIAICNSQSEFADFDHAGPTDGKSVRNSCKWMAGQKQIWAAEVKAISKVVCFISFNGMNDAGEMDAGHMMNEAHAGSDYDYEALAVLFDYCFRHDRPEAITALWMMDDRQKLAPLAKLGMRLINTGMGKSWRPNSEGVFWEAEGCRAVISREDWEHANPTSYSPKEKPEIVNLAQQAWPAAIEGAPTPYAQAFGIFQLPASRAIGVEQSLPLHGKARLPARPLWESLTDSETWKTLRALPQLIPGASLGWTCDYVAESDTFSYLACVLCPADTPVPAGCQFRDVPPTAVAAGLWGDTVEKVVKRMKKLGYAANYDAEGCGWNTELYFDEYHDNPPLTPKPNKQSCRWLVPCKKEEGYSPKEKPEIVSMAAAQSQAEQEIMPLPEIVTKRFLLAGFEANIDINESHWPGMDFVKTALKENLHKLGNLAQPPRFFDVWQADPEVNYKKKKNHSKCLFFFGTEVDSLDGVPEGFVVKDYPETTWALFKEREHGHAKWQWLEAAGFKHDADYAGKYAMDMEIFDDIEDEGAEWDALIPIIRPEGYSPKEKPEIVQLAEQTQKKKERFADRLSEITLVELPKAMVASYEVISDNPEQEGGAFIEAWLAKRGLKAGENGVTRYGFDCHKGRDICAENTACTKEQKGCWQCRIYHQYVTLPEGVSMAGDDDVAIKEFPGGRFARVAVRDPFTCDFPSAWSLLLKWAFRKKIPNRLGCASKKDCYSLFSNEESPCLEEIYEEDGVQYMALYLPVE